MFKNLTKEKVALFVATAITFISAHLLWPIPNDGPCTFFAGEPEYPTED